MSSPNFLKLVIEGQRNLTLSSADRFAQALDLNTQETAFLRELVGFAHAPTPAEKNRHYGNLSRYREHRTVRRLERDAFEYLSR